MQTDQPAGSALARGRYFVMLGGHGVEPFIVGELIPAGTIFEELLDEEKLVPETSVTPEALQVWRKGDDTALREYLRREAIVLEVDDAGTRFGQPDADFDVVVDRLRTALAGA